MKPVFAFAALVGLCFLTEGLSAAPKDVAGSSDHPLLTRFPGAVIVDYRQAAYDEYELPLGPGLGAFKKGYTRSEKVKGKFTSLAYVVPEGHSVIEVFENYQEALTKAGFQSVFGCVGEAECGDIGGKMGASWYADSRYVAAKGGDPAAPTYVALFVHKQGSFNTIGVFERVIESRAMKTGQITGASAADITRGLASQGKFALYGLYFDTGKAVLKPESNAALEQVAQVLKGNPSLTLYVVGHTDSQGQAKANLELSDQRAATAVKALVERYGIAKSRLTAKGVGPFAPVGPNKTEEGRAKNRRVELVEP